MLISQMSNSVLLKTQFDDNGAVQHISAFQIGQPTSALHGVANSKLYPGMVWVTLQKDNKLLLLDPVANSLESAPIIVKELDVPTAGQPYGAQGPHYISEYDGNLWPRPVFVVQNPANFKFYTGLDQSHSIAKIAINGELNYLRIPASRGDTPVGMISGVNGVWFTLLGNTTHGTGTIGFIDGNDNIAYHTLKDPVGQNASLLHLAFDSDYETNHVIWLLTSSIIKKDALDMLTKVTFDAQWKDIVSEDYVTLPTQISKAHRVFVTPKFVFATEFASSRVVAYLKN
ncbi:hypothetical protein BGZ68_002600 [Mortierella alpina]|nr:hypothetical protein BGZ68_002600 [Mortierella alpina]